MNIDNVTKQVQNFFDPLPPTKTATNLEELKNAVISTPEHLDVSIEWVKNLNGAGGHYRIHPVRELCCTTTSSPEVSNVVETKSVIRQELDEMRKKISSTATAVTSKVSAVFTSKGSEREAERKEAIGELTTFINRLDQAHAENPHAPINREFLSEIFSEHPSEDDREYPISSTHTPPVGKNDAPQIQEKEVREIVDCINAVKKEISSQQTKNLKNLELEQTRLLRAILHPDSKQTNPRPVTLSKEARELIIAIRKQDGNWIDQTLKESKPVSLDHALQAVIKQFPG